MPDLTANNLVAVKPYANISGNARYHCLDPDNTKVEFHWRGHLDVKCLTGNTYEMPDPVPSCISEVVCTDTPGKAKNLYPKVAPSRARNMCKIFYLALSKNLSPEKTETSKVFTFEFLNDEIDQNTNFAELPSAKWLFFGINCNSIISKLKSKHLVCHSFLW